MHPGHTSVIFMSVFVSLSLSVHIFISNYAGCYCDLHGTFSVSTYAIYLYMYLCTDVISAYAHMLYLYYVHICICFLSIPISISVSIFFLYAQGVTAVRGACGLHGTFTAGHGVLPKVPATVQTKSPLV